MHSPNPRPIIGILILSPSYFLVSCVYLWFLYWDEGGRALVFIFCGLPPVFGLHVLFSSDGHVCYWWLLWVLFLSPRSILLNSLCSCPTHPQAYTHTHLHFYRLPSSPTTSSVSGEIVVPIRNSPRVQSPVNPCSAFLNPRQHHRCLSRRFLRCP